MFMFFNHNFIYICVCLSLCKIYVKYCKTVRPGKFVHGETTFTFLTRKIVKIRSRRRKKTETVLFFALLASFKSIRIILPNINTAKS